MILSIIIILFVAFLAYLLLAPLVLEINTDEDLYTVNVLGLARADAVFSSDPIFALHLSILGFHKAIIPGSKPKEIKEPKAKKKVKRNREPLKMMRKGLNVLKSFRVRYMYVDLDTDNYLLNAYLYPIARFLSTNERRQIGVNFNGNTSVKLKITNSVGRMMLAYLR